MTGDDRARRGIRARVVRVLGLARLEADALEPDKRRAQRLEPDRLAEARAELDAARPRRPRRAKRGTS